MRPPTLRQLRMESIQNQILEKTKAGMPIGIQPIDSSNVMFGIEGYRKSSTKDKKINASGSKAGLAPSIKPAGGEPASSKRNLTYDEVKTLSDEFMLPCKSIYELHAEFNSILQIADAEKRNSSD